MSSLLKKAGLIFDENKVKPFLKMSITRLNLLVNKKANRIKVSKKEIAKLIADGKEEKARIKVEQVIREDFTIEAYDILELHCELLSERMRLIASQKDVPPDMEQAVCTIIWAADRAEVSELSTVKSQFVKKYGQDYVRTAELNEEGCVNPKVVEKLDCQPPSSYIVTEYLLSIAEEYGVEYTPAVPVRRKSSEAHDGAAASGPQRAYEAPGHKISPPPSGGGGGRGGGGGDVGQGGGGSGGSAKSVSDAPPVTAWAIPTEAIPHATATLSPHPSFREDSSDNLGGGGGGEGMPQPYPSKGKGPEYYGASGANGRPRPRPSGGFEEAIRGWDPTDPNEGKYAEMDGAPGNQNDPPPPYSPPRSYDHHDIPSAPTSRPVTLDIPAAPGYEDQPTRRHVQDGDDPPASSGDGNDMDDLAARFKNLRNP